MSTISIILCLTHVATDPEVEYLCSSLTWSAFWFVLGWLACICTVLLTGGRK